MARNCNCSGSTCGCSVIAGAGIQVDGIGTAASPFVIKNLSALLSSQFGVDDTVTVTMILLGEGTVSDPYVLSAVANVEVGELTDVIDAGPAAPGEVLTSVGTGGGRHWEYQPTFRPYTTAARPVPAALTPGSGIFNTTTNKPNWTDGTNWRDATGAIV
jgi:hypothetical protein